MGDPSVTLKARGKLVGDIYCIVYRASDRIATLVVAGHHEVVRVYGGLGYQRHWVHFA